MRILLVNYFWWRRSGGEAHVLDLAAMLEAAGHEVLVFSMAHPQNEASRWSGYWPRTVDFHSSMTRRQSLDAAARSIYSLEAAREVGRLVADARPDVAHLHGVHHQLTVSVVDELARSGTPQVWTLHDYRTVCPATSLLRNGHPCTRCSGGRFWHAVASRCKGQSFARSAAAAAECYLARSRGTLAKVDCYVSPSRYLAATALAMGLPAQRMEVLPNFTATGAVQEWSGGRRFLFVGRLTHEKGLSELLEALALVPGAALTVLGDGPDAGELRLQARLLGLDVDFRGWTSEEDVRATMAASRALLVPSLWYENCPLAVLEAMACGLPVVASDLGGLPELLDGGGCGTLVPAADPRAWAAAVGRVLAGDDGAAARATRARERARKRHDPASYLERLTGVYRDVAR